MNGLLMIIRKKKSNKYKYLLQELNIFKSFKYLILNLFPLFNILIFKISVTVHWLNLHMFEAEPLGSPSIEAEPLGSPSIEISKF